MSKLVATIPYLSIGGNSQAGYIKSMVINYSKEEKVIPCDTATGGTTRIAGLIDWSIEAEIYADMTNDSITEDLFGQVGSEVAVIAKLNGATTGTTNRKYTGNGIFFELNLGEQVGNEMVHKIVIKCSDGGTLTPAEAD